MPTGFPFVIPGLRTVLVADLFQGYLLIKAPGGTNLYMDPVSDATEEYYASTPPRAGSLREIRPPMDHTHTPLLRQTAPKQPQLRLHRNEPPFGVHRNLKVLGGQSGDRNHIYTFRINGIGQPRAGVEGHMDAHMLCEQRPAAN